MLILSSTLLALSTSLGAPNYDPPFGLPLDGRAEVARYRYQRTYYGQEVKGRAVFIVARENLNPATYVKTNKRKPAISAVKSMLIKTTPGMNWDYRDNLSVFSAEDLSPLRMSLTQEEWCGNNYREWVRHGSTVKLTARAYTDDTRPLDAKFSYPKGALLHEQLPLVVRRVVDKTKKEKLRIFAPQSAYVPQRSLLITVVAERRGKRTVRVPAGTFQVVEVRVKAEPSHEAFPHVEQYWVDAKSGFIVKAVVNEFGTERGKPHTGQATMTLLDHRRIAYWTQPLPPAEDDLASRQRATYSALLGMNVPRVFALRDGRRYKPEAFVKLYGKSLPAEYISDPRGNSRVAEARDNKGGWVWNPKGDLDGRKGRFELNVPPGEMQPR